MKMRLRNCCWSRRPVDLSSTCFLLVYDFEHLFGLIEALDDILLDAQMERLEVDSRLVAALGGQRRDYRQRFEQRVEVVQFSTRELAPLQQLRNVLQEQLSVHQLLLFYY